MTPTQRQTLIDKTADLFAEKDRGVARFVLSEVPDAELPRFVKNLLTKSRA